MDIERDFADDQEMTEEEIHAAALADPDCQPLTPERMARMKEIPRIKIIRRALRLSQEEFSDRYCIPSAPSATGSRGVTNPTPRAEHTCMSSPTNRKW